METLSNGLYESNDEVISNQQDYSSKGIKYSSDNISDELSLLLDEKNNIQKELTILRDKIDSLEKRKTEIDIRIKEISEVNIHNLLTNEETDEIDKERAVVGVKPKPLSIKGFDDIYWVLNKHVNSLVGSTTYSNPYSNFGDKLIVIANALSYLGKEVLFVKTDKENDKQMEEWKSIIDTCDKICKIESSGDKEGYKRYMDFFLQKYPWPNHSKETFSGPDLYLKNESVYEDAYLLMNYLIRFKDKIKEFYESNRNEFWNYTDYHIILNECKISHSFVAFMKMLYMVRDKGYTIAIVPIFDEDILYRPKQIAQADDIYSLYYFDDYVEEPFMVSDQKNESNNSPYYSFSGGSTYVSGHYRSGYWRNGRYVSGGYVKGHFRH